MREHATPRRPWGATLVLALLPLAACGGSSAAKEGGTLKFTAIPDEDKSALVARYGLVAEYLSEALDVPVEYVPMIDYRGSVEAFVHGDVHLAFFGGVTGVQARDRVEGARAIAQGKIDPVFKSYFIANASTGLEPSATFPNGMRGKTFTFGSPESTSGRLMPEFFIREATGQSPEEFFGHPDKYALDHQKVAEQVQDGVVECGALNYVKYDELVASGAIDPAVCVKIWETPTYADYSWNVRPDVEELFGAGFTQKLQDALVGIEDESVLKALGRAEGLIPATDAEFESIRTTMIDVGMLED
jgi:phosphonate transport system substrate-binding protein